MDKKIWKILGIVFTLITLVLIFLIIIIPITLKNKARDDVKEKSIPSEDNTRLWANFPGDLNSSTIHTLKILEYTEDRKNVSIKEIIELNETTEYDNFDFNTNEKRVFFDAKSKFKFVKEGTKKKENLAKLEDEGWVDLAKDYEEMYNKVAQEGKLKSKKEEKKTKKRR